ERDCGFFLGGVHVAAAPDGTRASACPPGRSGSILPACSACGVRYRWVVLAAGTAAQTSWSAIWFGVAVLAPALRSQYGLSLGETGALIAASLAGSTISLIPWGLLTDRVGERPVLGIGLGTCGLSLLAAAEATSFWPLLALLTFSGLAGASVS